VSSIHHQRRPRASPLWQIVHHAWDDFLASYEKHHRRTMGPLRPDSIATVRAFLCCGDLAAGFTRFTFPKMLRGIFRKRRHLFHVLFQTATECLRDPFRACLDLPGGRIAAAAAE
jgi:hypothetical protein